MYDLKQLIQEVGDAYRISDDGQSAYLIQSPEDVALLLVEVYGYLTEVCQKLKS